MNLLVKLLVGVLVGTALISGLCIVCWLWFNLWFEKGHQNRRLSKLEQDNLETKEEIKRIREQLEKIEKRLEVKNSEKL